MSTEYTHQHIPFTDTAKAGLNPGNIIKDPTKFEYKYLLYVEFGFTTKVNSDLCVHVHGV